MTVKRLHADKELVIGYDKRPGGRCEVFYCDSPSEAARKHRELLQKKHFPYARYGRVRDLLAI